MRFINREIFPHYLGTETMGQTFGSSMHGDTVRLMFGEVKKVISPKDQRSLTGKYLEYDVEVQHKEGPGSTVTVITFPNCLLINSLAGVADRTSFTLRSDSSVAPTGETNTTGAKVLLLCVDGDASRAFILGGIREDSTVDAADHSYFFEFNGVQQTINKDGEFQIRYRGATKTDGTLTDDANADAEGSTIVFDKDGGIKLYTKDEKQFLYLNHKDKKLEILADEEWNVQVNKKLTFEAGDTISIKGDSSCSIEVTDKTFIKSAGLWVGAASDAVLLGETYRNAESKLFSSLASTLQTIQGLITTAANTLTAASAANAPPTVGGAVAAVPFAAAGTALNSAGPLFAKMAADIQAFEALASTFLSKNNKMD
jgi:hypothetical protein